MNIELRIEKSTSADLLIKRNFDVFKESKIILSEKLDKIPGLSSGFGGSHVWVADETGQRVAIIIYG